MLSIQLLLVFMVIAAIVAVEIKDMISSVIALGTVGLGLSLSFLLLRAPDLAVILLIVEVLTLAVLVRTVSVSSSPAPRDRLASVTALAFVFLFLLVGLSAILELPAFGLPLMRISRYYLQEGMAQTGAANIVSSIALGFRAYDSLAGIAVLFLAAMGVIIIINERTEKDHK